MEWHHATFQAAYKKPRVDALNPTSISLTFSHLAPSIAFFPYSYFIDNSCLSSLSNANINIMLTTCEQQRSFLNGLPTVRIPPPVDVSFLHPDTNSLDVMVQLEVARSPSGAFDDWRICWPVDPSVKRLGTTKPVLIRQLKLFQHIDQYGASSYINWGAVTKHLDFSAVHALSFDIDLLDLTRRDQLCRIAHQTSVINPLDAYGPRRRPGDWVHLVLESAVAEGILSSEKVNAVFSAVRRSNLL